MDWLISANLKLLVEDFSLNFELLQNQSSNIFNSKDNASIMYSLFLLHLKHISISKILATRTAFGIHEHNCCISNLNIIRCWNRDASESQLKWKLQCKLNIDFSGTYVLTYIGSYVYIAWESNKYMDQGESTNSAWRILECFCVIMWTKLLSQLSYGQRLIDEWAKCHLKFTLNYFKGIWIKS